MEDQPPQVFGIGGLLLGHLIGTHLHGAPPQQPKTPRPGRTTPAPATPVEHRTAHSLAA
ncbi:hypothetical protein ACFZCG_38985 [Streptomyces tanashiensis]|uniref:hypothetical protein n=1 Tax=Streptomyces tanashiensis TaxID=67367 RepID=UPI0036EB5938